MGGSWPGLHAPAARIAKGHFDASWILRRLALDALVSALPVLFPVRLGGFGCRRRRPAAAGRTRGRRHRHARPLRQGPPDRQAHGPGGAARCAARRGDAALGRQDGHRGVFQQTVQPVEARPQGHRRWRAGGGGQGRPPDAHRGGLRPGRDDSRCAGRAHHPRAHGAGVPRRGLRRRSRRGGGCADRADRRRTAGRGRPVAGAAGSLAAAGGLRGGWGWPPIACAGVVP